jgi:hypothetical protein
MRIGRTSTICLLSIAAAYAAAFVACGGSETSGDGNTGTGTNGTMTTSGTSTTIVIAGTTGAGGAGGGTTGGTGGSGGSFDPDAACVAEPRAGEQVPLDLFFMVDKSGSMGCGVPSQGNCTSSPNPPPPVNRWTSIKEALTAFINSPQSAQLGMGVGFFPQYSNPNGTGTLRCNPQDYATPAAPIGILPGHAAAVQAAIDAQVINGNTPTVPALSGAVQYATAYAQTKPGRTVAIVFASDGLPTECGQNNNNIAGAEAVARAAAMGTPPIRTYVLGVGPSLQNLNAIAAAGGTNAAHLVESGGAAELITALNMIRKNALTCDYQIPIIPGRPLDLTLVAIKVKVGSTGMEQYIARVDSVAQCGATQGGWYFDNPSAPTKITLCPGPHRLQDRHPAAQLSQASGPRVKRRTSCAAWPTPCCGCVRRVSKRRGRRRHL